VKNYYHMSCYVYVTCPNIISYNNEINMYLCAFYCIIYKLTDYVIKVYNIALRKKETRVMGALETLPLIKVQNSRDRT
jgi:hypothetical protein